MIKIENLNFFYQRKHQVYDSLNLTIEDGAVCALLGLNGAGKTTLLNLIAGFLIPKAGSCQVFGHEASCREPEMLEEIFLVGDTSEFPNMTIAEFCNLYSGFYPKFDQKLLSDCISEFGLNPGSSLKRLSYGDKRKVMISFAIATRCRILLFDEPTNGLDIPSKSTFRRLIAASLTEDQTIIMATHQVRDLANLMDRVIIEQSGKIILNESIDRVAEKLVFGAASEQIAQNELIYKSDSFNPNETVSINKNGQAGQVDIELLFTATIARPQEIVRIFTTQN